MIDKKRLEKVRFINDSLGEVKSTTIYKILLDDIMEIIKVVGSLEKTAEILKNEMDKNNIKIKGSISYSSLYPFLKKKGVSNLVELKKQDIKIDKKIAIKQTENKEKKGIFDNLIKG